MALRNLKEYSCLAVLLTFTTWEPLMTGLHSLSFLFLLTLVDVSFRRSDLFVSVFVRLKSSCFFELTLVCLGLVIVLSLCLLLLSHEGST